jgi:hypothetical protein
MDQTGSVSAGTDDAIAKAIGRSQLPILAELISHLARTDGLQALTVRDLSGILGNRRRVTPDLHALKDLLLFGTHVFVTTAIFLFILLGAVGLEIVIHMLRDTKHYSELLVSMLTIGEYAVLGFDLIMLFARLSNGTWVYLRGLRWN